MLLQLPGADPGMGPSGPGPPLSVGRLYVMYCLLQKIFYILCITSGKNRARAPPLSKILDPPLHISIFVYAMTPNPVSMGSMILNGNFLLASATRLLRTRNILFVNEFSLSFLLLSRLKPTKMKTVSTQMLDAIIASEYEPCLTF